MAEVQWIKESKGNLKFFWPQIPKISDLPPRYGKVNGYNGND
jgi:hypothetical protein